jgi:hypothetical protein
MIPCDWLNRWEGAYRHEFNGISYILEIRLQFAKCYLASLYTKVSFNFQNYSPCFFHRN